jgi:hypothetical protein
MINRNACFYRLVFYLYSSFMPCLVNYLFGYLMTYETIMDGEYIGIQMRSVVTYSTIFYFLDIVHPSVLT